MKKRQSLWRRVVVDGVPLELRVVLVEGEYFGLCLPVNLAVDGASVEQVLERMKQLVLAWMFTPEHMTEGVRSLGSPPELLNLVGSPDARRFQFTIQLPPSTGNSLELHSRDLLKQPRSLGDALVGELFGWMEAAGERAELDRAVA